MTVEPPQTKTGRLDASGISTGAREVDEIALVVPDSELHVTLSKRDFSAFSNALRSDFNPNSALTNALVTAKQLILPE